LILTINIIFYHTKSFKKHVEYLASNELMGRYPCSIGDTLTSKYISDFHNVFNATLRYQDFNYLSRIDRSGKVTVRLGLKVLDLKYGHDFFPDLESSAGVLSSKFVFAGFGRTENGYNDFHGIEIKEKAIIFFNSPPVYFSEEKKKIWAKGFSKQKVYKKLQNERASCIIYVTPSYSNQQFYESNRNKYVSQRNQQTDIPILTISADAFNNILHFCSINTDDFQKLIDDLENSINFQFKDSYLDINVNVSYHYKNTNNIYNYIKGIDTIKTLVVGAHYDHLPPKKYADDPDSVRNGADDNASGVSLLLELSRYFSCQKKIPRHNLVFIFFSGEESNMMGSRFFLNNIPDELHTIKAMINIDMVGRLRNNTLYIGFSNTSNDWENILDNIKSNKIKIQKLDKNNKCDNSSFCDKEIPNILFTTGIHEDIHKPSDESDRINYNGMQEIFDIVKQTIEITDKYDFLHFNNNFK
jgi:hypothetical protein